MCNYFGSDIVFMAKRIGVFGGSFNPLHIGHLIVAEAAWQEFNLEQVVFVPTGDTPHKNMHHISKIDRFEMVKMAIKRKSSLFYFVYRNRTKRSFLYGGYY